MADEVNSEMVVPPPIRILFFPSLINDRFFKWFISIRISDLIVFALMLGRTLVPPAMNFAVPFHFDINLKASDKLLG
jgi:hypothetical protein